MKKLIAISALALSFSASAESVYLYTETSLPGETMDEFVVRITPRANSHTKASGHEVCGAIRESDSSYSLDITTSNKNHECELPGDTQVYFHTHPINQGLGFSAGDYIRPGYLATPIAIKFQDGKIKRPRKISSF